MKSKKRIRVMLVDDHEFMRETLQSIINSQPDLTVAAQANSGPTALEVIGDVKPDVVLMDGSMPEMNGIEATRRLKQLAPKVKIIGLSLYEQSTYLEEMVAVGASGYLLKTSRPENVIEAVRAVAAGDTYFDAAIPTRSAAKTKRRLVARDLRPEELAVAKRVAEGQTSAEVSTALNLTPKAVEKHKKAAMKKLDVQTRAELVRIAAERHWFDK